MQIWGSLYSFFCYFTIRELAHRFLRLSHVYVPGASCVMKCLIPGCHTVWHHPCLLETSWCLQNVHWILVCQSPKVKPETLELLFQVLMYRRGLMLVGFLSCCLVFSSFAYGYNLILHKYLQIIYCFFGKYIPQTLPLKTARSLADKTLPVLTKSHCPTKAVVTNFRHVGQFSSRPPLQCLLSHPQAWWVTCIFQSHTRVHLLTLPLQTLLRFYGMLQFFFMTVFPLWL